jgi:catechol 2,3-dioxygenase-like lactoylglutathione lyase family enzyme
MDQLSSASSCISTNWRSYSQVFNNEEAQVETTTTDAHPGDGGIDTAIYPMPGFVTFTVTDVAASMHWYVDGLGFVLLAELPGPDGRPALVHLRRHRYQDILLVPAPPGEVETTSRGAAECGVRAGAEDLYARAAQARRIGSGTVEGPARTPWNTLDLVCRDLDGYEVVLTEGVAADLVDQQFAETVRRLVRV